MTRAENGRPGDRPEAITGTDDGAAMDENIVLVEASRTDDDSRLDGGAPAEPGLAHERAGTGASGLSGTSATSAAGEADARLANADESDLFAARWQEIQAEFVDDPRRAVQDADALIADMMERLAQLLASEREQLKPRGNSGDDASTEDLRQGLQRYRSLFQRLLAA